MTKPISRGIVACVMVAGAACAFIIPPSKQECQAACVDRKQRLFEQCQELSHPEKQDCLNKGQDVFQACIDGCKDVT